MKFKGVITFLFFFVGTPLLLGQGNVPNVPAINLPTSTPSSLISSQLPQTPSFDTPSSLPLDSLRDAGINTDQAIPSNPAQAARDLQGQYSRQGILNNDTVTGLPNTDNASDLAKEFARKTFPEEYQAAQGKLGNIPTTVPSDIPSSLPGNIPNTPTLPSTPTLPGGITTTPLPSIPSI